MKTVLVVDDEVGLLEVIAHSLEDAGLRVVTAGNGSEGLEAFERWQPDLIVTDFMMPQMSGPEMARRIRERRTARDLPIVLVSAVPSVAETEGKGLFDAVFRKPFRIFDLVGKVEALLANGSDLA